MIQFLFFKDYFGIKKMKARRATFHENIPDLNQEEGR